MRKANLKKKKVFKKWRRNGKNALFSKKINVSHPFLVAMALKVGTGRTLTGFRFHRQTSRSQQ